MYILQVDYFNRANALMNSKHYTYETKELLDMGIDTIMDNNSSLGTGYIEFRWGEVNNFMRVQKVWTVIEQTPIELEPSKTTTLEV